MKQFLHYFKELSIIALFIILIATAVKVYNENKLLDKIEQLKFIETETEIVPILPEQNTYKIIPQ